MPGGCKYIYMPTSLQEYNGDKLFVVSRRRRKFLGRGRNVIGEKNPTPPPPPKTPWMWSARGSSKKQPTGFFDMRPKNTAAAPWQPRRRCACDTEHKNCCKKNFKPNHYKFVTMFYALSNDFRLSQCLLTSFLNQVVYLLYLQLFLSAARRDANKIWSCPICAVKPPRFPFLEQPNSPHIFLGCGH